MFAERFAYIFTVGLLMSACGGAGMEANTPVNEKTKFRDDQLFGAAERAIEKLGYYPVNPDAEQLTVDTREKEVGYSSVPRLSYKYTFHIEVKQGTLHISSTCKQNTAMKREEFGDCGDERPQRVLDEQEQLKQTILQVAAQLP